MKLLSLSLVLALVSCNQSEQSPEESLKAYVEMRIGQVVEREKIEEKITGKLLANLQAMPADEFKSYADLKNVKSNSFKILSKTCEEKKCSLTYSVGYTTKIEGKDRFVSEVKKIAELIEVDEKWLIADVNNVQTFHESLEPLDISKQ